MGVTDETKNVWESHSTDLFPNVFPINCYFVRESDGLTLVGTGIKSSAKEIIAAAKSLQMPIVRIALTHAHTDHAGSLHILHQQLPDVEVIVSTREVRFLRSDHSLDPDEPQAPLRGGFAQYPYSIRTVSSGHHIGSLVVVDCPGHTPGHVGFFDTRDKTLIAGDAFQTRGGIAVAGVVRPLFPFLAFGTWNKLTALESSKKLLELEPNRLAVGHGAVLSEPVDAMNGAIRVAERKIDGLSAYAPLSKQRN